MKAVWKPGLSGLLCLMLLGLITWLRFQSHETTLCVVTRPFSAQNLFADQPCSWPVLGPLLAELGYQAAAWQLLPDLLFWGPALWLAARAVPRIRIPTWLVFILGLGFILAVQSMVLHRYPVSGDESSYLLQAKLIGQGKLKGASRGELDRHFQSPSVIFQGGIRSKYQLGWPFLLCLAGWLANPLSGLGCLILAYLLALRLELGREVAALTAGGLSLSAFFVFNCASLSVHPSCLFFTLLFLWGWQCQKDGSHSAGLLAACLAVVGLCNTRLVELPLLGAMAVLWVPRNRWNWLWLAAALLLGLALLGWTNQLQNGDPMLLGFSVYDPEDRWGFGVRGHEPARALWNQSFSLLRYLAWMPAGWLISVVPGVTSPPRLRRLAIGLLVAPAFYTGFYSLGLVEYGPRYWFVPGLLLSLCAAAGAARLCSLLQSKSPGHNWLGGLIFITLLQGLLQLCTIARACSQQVEPARLQHERAATLLAQREPTLVLLQPGGGARSLDWVRFNSPELNDYVLFAYFLDPSSNQQLIQAYPGHQPMVMTQSLDASGGLTGGLEPYHPPLNRSQAVDQSLRAGENYLSEFQDAEKAASCFEAALKLDPDNLYAHAYSEQIESQRGHWEQAITHGRFVVEAAPNNSKARYLLALDLARAGQDAEARRQMTQVATTSGPESEKARRWLQLSKLR